MLVRSRWFSDTVSYSLDDDAGGTDNAIDANTGIVTRGRFALDAETATSHNMARSGLIVQRH